MQSIDRHLQWILVVASILLMILATTLSACGSPRPALDAALITGSPGERHQAIPEPAGERQNQAATVTMTPESQYTPTVEVDQIMSSPDYGMQAFLFWQAEIADRDLKLIEDAGFRWVKQEFPWREIEGLGKGRWQWDIPDRIMDQIDAHQLKVIARLGAQPRWASSTVTFPEVGPPDDLQDFYDYVYALASRYRGRIDAYQLWNEPNLAREWGGRPPDPAAYVELLRVGYKAVKAADPGAIVISAGMAPTTRHDVEAVPDTYFLQGMYDAGASPYFDVLGVHAPGFKSEPEIDPAVVAADPALSNNDSAPPELRRVYAFRRVEDLRDLMVENGDAQKKVAVLEFGWTVDPRPDSPYRWHAVSERQQDKYLQRAFAYAEANWQPWIGVMNVIYIADPRWHFHDEQVYWSIVYPGYPDLNTAMAYYGLLYMPKVPPVEGDSGD